MFKEYQLKNGARVILVPQHDTKAVTTLVMFPVGSRYEPAKLAGASHYVEHLMFKGTKKRKNTFILTREIDRLGAEYNAFTGKEYTGYYIKADAQYSSISFDIISDMLYNSTFEPKEMEREKGPIIEEIRMYNDNPLINIENIFEDLMFDGCPLGRDIAGTVKHVQNYQRPDILAYRDKHYHPSNMIIVIAGAVEQRTEDLLDKYFGSNKKKKAIQNKFTPAKFGSTKKEDRLVIKEKKTDQAQMMIGFPGFAYGDKRNPIVSVMNTILGGSMSSRLFIQVRERHGLAYMVRSGADQFRDTGYIYIRVALDAKNINKALTIIKKEIDKLIKTGVTDRELKDAKTHIRGGSTLSMEDSSSLANYFAGQALFQEEMVEPEEKLKKIDAVTAKQVQQLAKQIFKENQMRVAIIGDVNKADIVL